MKHQSPIQEIIASRDLEFVDQSGKKQLVKVDLGMPVQEEDGPWFCPYQITAETFECRFRIYGEDSMQALLLALQIVVTELQRLAVQHDGYFTWFGETDLGFV